MVFREQVVNDIYVFTSEMYLQVTAGAIFSPEGTVIIDTLPFPQESRAMRDFISERSSEDVLYVINTHYHADHVYGNYLYSEADIISWKGTRLYLERHGEESLRQAKEETPELAEVELRLPNVLFDRGRMFVHLGDRTLELIHAPGPTPDSIVVHIREDQLLFAGDIMMPVPYIVWGDWQDMIDTLGWLKEMKLDHLVQGHGEVLLRGEIPSIIEERIAYLHEIHDRVAAHVADGGEREQLKSWGIEDFGLSRLSLGGLAPQLHQANLLALYAQLSRESGDATGI
ncbi:MAG: MBL fold metallo-hydrolase [Chloroflexota bacterium]|nr:MBL fold metallo-hydrolase [Chloroflexota bacterium]